MLLGFMDVPMEWISLAAIVLGLASFYITKGKTLSDVLTRTRVVYLMPPDERRRR